MTPITVKAAGRIRRAAASKRLQGAALGVAVGSLLTTSVAIGSVGAPASPGAVIRGCVSKVTRVLTVPSAGHL